MFRCSASQHHLHRGSLSSQDWIRAYSSSISAPSGPPYFIATYAALFMQDATLADRAVQDGATFRPTAPSAKHCTHSKKLTFVEDRRR